VEQTNLSKKKIYIVPVRKIIKSAAANAQHNFGLNKDRLIIGLSPDRLLKPLISFAVID